VTSHEKSVSKTEGKWFCAGDQRRISVRFAFISSQQWHIRDRFFILLLAFAGTIGSPGTWSSVSFPSRNTYWLLLVRLVLLPFLTCIIPQESNSRSLCSFIKVYETSNKWVFHLWVWLVCLYLLCGMQAMQQQDRWAKYAILYV